MTFTQRVRDELARLPAGGEDETAHEAAGLLRAGGALVLPGGAGGRAGFGVVFRTPSGPVARRLRAALHELGARPEIEVHRPAGLQRRSSYQLRLGPVEAPVLRRLGLIGEDGHPAEPRMPRPTGSRPAIDAHLRGAVMGGGTLSDPRSAPHAEIVVAGEPTARHLAALLATAGAPGATAGRHDETWRVVCKSGEQIGDLLATLGAHTAFLEWDDARLRRELRGQANRVANADRANLARAVGAAARHVAAIERLVAVRGWDGLPDELRQLALARVTNPEASLAELGGLLDPPAGKAAVHRRMGTLMALAEAEGTLPADEG